MEQILIIEDDISLNQGLCRALKSENRQIISCININMAKDQISCSIPNLIILDINLPDGNGLDFLKEIRKYDKYIPVILLTANDTDIDIVNGLEQGADDYITKPFSLSILRARVNTQLRRNSLNIQDNTINIDDFSFNFEKMIFRVNNIPVELSKTEQKLLRILVENKGNTMKRSTLIDYIWTDNAEYVDENALSVTIKRLRDKLNAYNYIHTVYGIGYIWVKK